MSFNRPYVFLSTGMSLDGKISTFERVQSEISVDTDRSFMYDGRIKADAVMVGGRTLLLDDPGLTVKTKNMQKHRLLLGKTPQPYKVGIVSDATKLKIDGDFMTRGYTKKIIFTTTRTPRNKLELLKKCCLVYVHESERVDLKQALSTLYDLEVRSLMVEGGGELNYSLFKEDLVDEINLVIGDLILGGRSAPTLVDGDGFASEYAKKTKLVNMKKQGNRLILRYEVLK